MYEWAAEFIASNEFASGGLFIAGASYGLHCNLTAYGLPHLLGM